MSGRSVLQDLADLSSQSVKGMRIAGKLAAKFGSAAEARRQSDLQNAREFNLNIPQMVQVQNKIAEELDRQATEIHANLPVASLYDAHRISKSHVSISADAGVHALTSHMERLWKKDRTGSLTAETYLTLHNHYKRNYPKSAAADIIAQIGEQGYATLPVTDLERIASQVRTQEDFEKAVLYHGLNGSAPHQVKARKFILALVNEADVESTERRSGGVAIEGGAEELLRMVGPGGITIVKDGVGGNLDDYGGDLDMSEPQVFVAIVYEVWSNNSVGGALHFSHANGDVALGEASKSLQTIDSEALSDQDLAKLESDAAEYGMGPDELLTEKYEGALFTMTPAEFAEIIQESGNEALSVISIDNGEDEDDEGAEGDDSGLEEQGPF